MDTTEQFRRAEEEYGRLKEQFDSGSITQDQFDAAVKRLTVRDEQGHTWAMGDNGYWSMSETGPSPAPPTVSPPPTLADSPRGSTPRWLIPLLALAGLGFIGLVCVLGAGGAFFYSGGFRVGQAPGPTLTLQQAPTLFFPTLTPAATDTAPAPSATFALPNFALTGVPTVEATATVSETVDVSSPPPAGIYVVGLRVDPPAPVRKQDIRFHPVFLNTTPAATNLRWKVLVYRPNNMKNSLGETGLTTSEIPVGQGEILGQGAWKLTGPGECDDFIARVATVNDQKRTSILNKTDGTPYEIKFTVCK